MNTILNSPFLGILLCLLTFLFGRWLQKKTGWVIANPLVVAVILCISVLLLFDIPYESFTKGADVINWMLGPVTALLALSIYNQRQVLKAYFIPVLAGCLAGSLTSMFSILGLCRLFGVDQAITASILPKSCTTPIALSIAESHGGLAAIAACCVIVAGVTGALCAPLFAKWFGITDPVAQGLATGACSHALGTTRAREMGEVQGAMSSIAIGVCGLISVAISLLIRL